MFQQFLSAFLIVAVSADTLLQGQISPILRQSQDITPEGSYQYFFETANGISAQESGYGGKAIQGSSQYVAPNGQPIQLSYTADEFGYQPKGDHLPISPPIPESILRSLEYIRTHPSKESQPELELASRQTIFKAPFAG